MNDDYEQISFAGYLDSFRQAAPDWGRDGWEVTAISGSAPYFLNAAAKRLKRNWQPWEYHFFSGRFYGLREWHDHIVSCGWTIISGPPLCDIYGSYLMAKRPGSWGGADDGDIAGLLWNLVQFRTDEGIIKEILDLKWQRSQQAGHNIGTYAAVVAWLATKRLPELYRAMGMPMPDGDPEQTLETLNRRFPGGDLGHKVLSDIADRALPEAIRAVGMEPPSGGDRIKFAENILAVRGELGNGGSTPPLEGVVKLLADQLRAWAGSGVQLPLEDAVYELAKYRGALRGGKRIPNWVKEFWSRSMVRDTAK